MLLRSEKHCIRHFLSFVMLYAPVGLFNEASWRSHRYKTEQVRASHSEVTMILPLKACTTERIKLAKGLGTLV